MKITIITSRYPSSNNPYNHMFVHMRSVEFLKQEVEVEVYVPSNIESSYIHEGVKVYKMPSKSIAKLLKKKEIIYLHLLNIYPFNKADGWPIYKRILRENTPFAMYVHGSEVQKFTARMFDFNYSLDTFLRWIKKDLLVIPKMKRFVRETKGRDNCKYIFPSIWMKEELETNLDQKLENFEIIPNGIDTNLFRFNDSYENRYKLLTLRPLSSKKYAVDIAIETMKYLPKEFTLHIYGKGHLQSKYQKQIDDAKLSKRVTIKNEFIDRSEMNEFFTKYGIFLSPTRMDAQGVTMCEAMASGLLVASNNNTAIPEFIEDNYNGLLSNDSKSLAQKILKITENIEPFKLVIYNGRRSMEKISIDKTVSNEIKSLEAIIQ
ncbi:MAG: hypothetical protein CL524_04505 [Aequorivita sp.]|nr:hypothetical protein [Aequorivita sp.]MBF30066.1 hypothetical protein [Aequorivita sp.]|tara:strand:+ start:266180 stop:267307 length:1128 start_codon:yes stop_codon:yes gene_type:complete